MTNYELAWFLRPFLAFVLLVCAIRLSRVFKSWFRHATYRAKRAAGRYRRRAEQAKDEGVFGGFIVGDAGLQQAHTPTQEGRAHERVGPGD